MGSVALGSRILPKLTAQTLASVPLLQGDVSQCPPAPGVCRRTNGALVERPHQHLGRTKPVTGLLPGLQPVSSGHLGSR